MKTAWERDQVYKVYDKIAPWFSTNRPLQLNEQKYLDDLISKTAIHGTILDVGCGNGKPIMEYLISQQMKLTGVDGSKEMLNLAKRNFPDAEFILQDMRLLQLNTRFDAIIAWHSFFHLPATDQPEMFAVFQKHLKPNGILLFTSGTANGEAWGMNGGENLFHASLDTEEYAQILKEFQFEVLSHTVNDETCGDATVWMARYNPQ